MPSNPARLSLVGVSSSAGYPLWMPDISVTPFSVLAQLEVPAGSSGQTVNLEGTTDYQGNLSSCFSGWISSAANWVPLLSGVSSSQNVTISAPYSCIRLNVVSGAAGLPVGCNLIQAG